MELLNACLLLGNNKWNSCGSSTLDGAQIETGSSLTHIIIDFPNPSVAADHHTLQAIKIGWTESGGNRKTTKQLPLSVQLEFIGIIPKPTQMTYSRNPI